LVLLAVPSAALLYLAVADDKGSEPMMWTYLWKGEKRN